MYRRLLAAFLATLLFSTQVLGQTLSTVSFSESFPNQLTEAQPELQQQFRLFDHLLAATSAEFIIAQAGSSNTVWPAEIDIDPPAIDHEALESGVSGEPQLFKAVVVDDRGLKHVMLYYRDKSGTQYQSVEMQNVTDSSQFSTTIETSLGQSRIEYYIEALDSGGNRVLKGFPFFPLVRELSPATANTAAVAETSTSQSRVLYMLLGVAAVGVALALMGDDSEPTQPSVNTVPLNIVISPP